MSALLWVLIGLVFACLGLAPSQAASLRVAPTMLDLVLPQAAATLNLRNEANRPLNVQIRVFRWTQSNGTERLEPTTNVVASPPSTRLAPNTDYVVRVVRVGSNPAVAEEAYRVVVDELPDPSRRRAGVIDFVLRFSVPVFFRSTEATLPQVTWAVRPRGNAVTVVATNAGQRHLRIANLQLKDGAGRHRTLRRGLVGYVLGGARMQWSFPIGGRGLSGRSVTLLAESNTGQINAPALVQSGR